MCHSPGQRGRQIHLQQPGFEVGVNEHIETIQLCGGKTQTDQSQTGEVGTIRDPSDPIRENKGWRVSESPVFPRVYRGPITCGTWRRRTRVVLLLITRMLYTQSLKKETLNHSCYRGIGSIALTKYTHVSSVTNLLMQDAWSNAKSGCEYFTTYSRWFSRGRECWEVYILSLYINEKLVEDVQCKDRQIVAGKLRWRVDLQHLSKHQITAVFTNITTFKDTAQEKKKTQDF